MTQPEALERARNIANLPRGLEVEVARAIMDGDLYRAEIKGREAEAKERETQDRARSQSTTGGAE